MSTEIQDAARYRWLRAANNGVCVVMPIWPDDARTMHTEELDAALDAAMNGQSDPVADWEREQSARNARWLAQQPRSGGSETSGGNNDR